jgi:predicted acyl esterase
MSIGSRIFARLWNLSAPHTRDVVEYHDIRVSMFDGVELLTDRYHPRGGEKLPVVLIRSPYGRGDEFRDLAHVLRPFHVNVTGPSLTRPKISIRRCSVW